MEQEKCNALKAQFDIIISQLENLTDEQVVLDFLDKLNAISVKH